MNTDKVRLLLTIRCTASLEVTHIKEEHYTPFTLANKPTNTRCHLAFVWNVIIRIYFSAS